MLTRSLSPHYYSQEQLNNASTDGILQINHKLNEIYPHIQKQDELCNKHSLGLIRIKHKFQVLYNQEEINRFVIANGLAMFTNPIIMNNVQEQEQEIQHTSLYKDKCMCIEMVQQHGNQVKYKHQCYIGIQNGCIIAISKIENSSNTNIYINYNRWQQHTQQKVNTQQQQYQQELILSKSGQIIKKPTFPISQQQYDVSLMLSQLYQQSIEDISINKLNGMILYIHNGIKQGCFFQFQALIWSFYIAILSANQIIFQYSLTDIAKRINSCVAKYHIQYNNGNSHQIQQKIRRMNQYSRIILSFYNNDHTIQRISLNKGHRFIFCNIDSQSQNVFTSKLFHKKQKVQQFVFDSSSSLVCMLKEYQNKLFKQYLKNQHLCQNNQQNTSIDKIEVLMQKMKQFCIQSINQKTINSNQLLPTLIQSLYNLYTGFLISQNMEYIIFATTNRNGSQLIRNINKIRAQQQKQRKMQQQIKQNEIEYKYNNKNNKDIIDQTTSNNKYKGIIKTGKWGRSIKKEQHVFSSSSCINIGILDPRSEIWYIQ